MKIDEKQTTSVCLIAPVPPPYGGIGNWVRIVLEEARSSSENIDISTISTSPKKRSTEGRKIKDRILGGGLSLVREFFLLLRVLLRNQYDVVHLTTSGQLALSRDILLLSLARLFRVRTVYHVHFGRIPQIRKQKTIEWYLFAAAFRIANRTIVIDRDSFQTICSERAKWAEKVIYVPNPTDNSNETQNESTRSGAFLSASTLERKADGNFPSGEFVKPYIVFLGWVLKTKGVEELLEAWESISESVCDWALEVIGPCDPDYMAYLKGKYALKNVNFRGELSHSDAMNVLRHCEVFVLPSYTEGFPYSVLEAMSLKKPVIASRVGAIPEMLDSGCGILIDVASVKQLVAAMERLISDKELRTAIGMKGAEKVKLNFSSEVIMPKLYEIWRGGSVLKKFSI